MADAHARVGEILGSLGPKVVDAFVRRDPAGLEPLESDAIAHGTITRNPATNHAISAAEERLGARLPAEYAAFLQVSNGLTLPSFEGHAIALLPVENIERFEVADKDAFDIWCDGSGSPQFAPLAVMAGDVTQFVENVPDQRVLRDAVALSEIVSTGGVFLCRFPAFGADVSEIWVLGPWTGCVRYRDFRCLIESHLRDFLTSAP